MTSPLGWLFGGGGPLRVRVLRGGLWLVLGDALVRVVGLVKLAIVGRLLSPDDFGLMGIALLSLTWLEYFTETGFDAALVRKQEDIGPYLDTAWTVQLLRCVGIALGLALGAPLAGGFFENHEAAPVVRGVALVVLLRGLVNPAVVHLRKELDFRREVVLRVSGAATGLVVAVIFALGYRNVWALVLSLVADQAVKTLVSYWIRPYRPRLRLEWSRARELMSFGKWLFYSNMIAFVGMNADSLCVGKLLGTASLGFYQMAQQFANAPTSRLGVHLRGVLFPAFSRLQAPSDLRRPFLHALSLVAVVVVPIGCGLTVFAEPLVMLALGSRWLEICPALRWLAWAGVAAALMGVLRALFQAVGKPQLSTRSSALNVLLLAGLLYPLIRAFGLSGAAVAVSATNLAELAFEFWLAGRLTGLAALEMVSAFKLGALGSAPFLVAGALVAPSLSVPLIASAAVAAGIHVTIVVTALRARLGTWAPPALSGPSSGV